MIVNGFNKIRVILSFGLAIVLALLFVSVIEGCNRPESNDDQIKIHNFPPTDPSTSSSDSVKLQTPVIPTPQTSPDVNNQDVIERHIIVDARNNIFSIGVPSRQIEETKVVAENPIDFWFEYVPDDLILEINGIPIERSFRWESKIGHTTGIKSFEYTATNTTTQYFSYNLHLIPSKEGKGVSVTVHQKWSPLAH